MENRHAVLPLIVKTKKRVLMAHSSSSYHIFSLLLLKANLLERAVLLASLVPLFLHLSDTQPHVLGSLGHQLYLHSCGPISSTSLTPLLETLPLLLIQHTVLSCSSSNLYPARFISVPFSCFVLVL